MALTERGFLTNGGGASCLAILAALLAPATAMAATPEEITRALADVVAKSPHGGTLTLGTPSVETDALVYRDVVYRPREGDETHIATLTLANAAIGDGGTVTADDVRAEGVTTNGADTSVAAATVELVNPVFSGDDAGTRLDSVAFDSVTISEHGKPPVHVDSVGIDFGDYSGDLPQSVDLSVEGVVLDPDILDETPTLRDRLKSMGYDQLTLNFYGTGEVDPDSGDLTVEEITVDGDNMGTLTLTGEFGGVTRDVLARLKAPTPEPITTIFGGATLKSASLYYNDASLAGRAVADEARKAGQDPAAFTAQVSAALPLFLMSIGNQTFQDKLATGAAAFLKDPKNLEVTLSPTEPVPLSKIIEATATAPQTLPDLLNADVAANQDETMDGDSGTGETGGDSGGAGNGDTGGMSHPDGAGATQ